MRFWSLASVVSLCLTACGDKSAVSLTVTFDQAAVSAENGTLGAALSGGFRLQFALGPEASGPTTVTLGSFAVQTEAGSALVDPVQVDASGASFPLVVDKGSMQSVTFTLSSSKLLTSPVHDALCAGPVILVGSVMDSLKGGTDPLRSTPITPTCS